MGDAGRLQQRGRYVRVRVQAGVQVLQLRLEEGLHGETAADVVHGRRQLGGAHLLLGGLEGRLHRGRVRRVGADAHRLPAGLLDLGDDVVVAAWRPSHQDHGVGLGEAQGARPARSRAHAGDDCIESFRCHLFQGLGVQALGERRRAVREALTGKIE